MGGGCGLAVRARVRVQVGRPVKGGFVLWQKWVNTSEFRGKVRTGLREAGPRRLSISNFPTLCVASSFFGLSERKAKVEVVPNRALLSLELQKLEKMVVW